MKNWGIAPVTVETSPRSYAIDTMWRNLRCSVFKNEGMLNIMWMCAST